MNATTSNFRRTGLRCCAAWQLGTIAGIAVLATATIASSTAFRKYFAPNHIDLSGFSATAVRGIYVDKIVLDLGAVDQGRPPVANFVILNANDFAITTPRIMPECGCMSAVIGENRIGAGEKARLAVTIAPPTQGALNFRKGITLIFGSEIAGTARATKVFVEFSLASPALSIFPTHIDMVDLRQGQSVDFTIYTMGSQSTLAGIPKAIPIECGHVVTIALTSGATSATLLEATRLRLFASPQATLGPQQTRVIFQISGSSQERMVLPVQTRIVR
jgi:hypothetical protein